MARLGVARLGEEVSHHWPEPELPPLPVIDNERGGLEALLKANKILRGRRWPGPYDRTYESRLSAFDQELVLRFFSLKNWRSNFRHDIGDFLTD